MYIFYKEKLTISLQSSHKRELNVHCYIKLNVISFVIDIKLNLIFL